MTKPNFIYTENFLIKLFFFLTISWVLLCNVALADDHSHSHAGHSHDHSHGHAHNHQSDPSYLQAPPGLSQEEFMKWEAENIVAETVQIQVKDNLIYVNNRVCPLKRGKIFKPYDKIKVALPYQGKVEKFKGKTFVFNFCCTNCQSRFPTHFKKYPDIILKKYGLI